MQQFKTLGMYSCVEESHIITEKNRYYTRRECIMRLGEGMGWMSHTATKETSLQKCPCVMTAVVQKHLDAGTQRRKAIISQFPQTSGDKELRKLCGDHLLNGPCCVFKKTCKRRNESMVLNWLIQYPWKNQRIKSHPI